jgi:magnesium-transporting ATPase (P-type)
MKPLNKKAYIGDVLIWGVILLVLVVIAFLFYNLLSSAADSTAGDTQNAQVHTSLTNSTLGWASGWDTAIVAALGFMFLASLVTAWIVGTDSLFFWITLIVTILCLIAMIAVNNIANTFIDDQQFAVVASNMPGTVFIIHNLFMIVLGGTLLLLVVLFAKPKDSYGA